MQELDEAARRRLPKQVYVALPDAAARRSMLMKQLGEAMHVFHSCAHAHVFTHLWLTPFCA